uniref:PITH domain-containing protein n=1 Tax=Mantoniella antarctica TaxID=81844 RepID=A0A7S0X9Y9_9CHLO|eukprot:CAMPEP_0198691142 /NCGR_PEP_ID=MMETSP1468-20131203/196755_1 /TAXON_ID=1461545 /ORGANISM="Mantoniella sp, Strain CCMP1436" /LENGTH=166 /DNA_ID=CAMNT_0044444103 /DNA_START=42 /DNA_END=542 /DNA_ORIENTATION=+
MAAKETDLLEEMDLSSVECLNQATGKDWGNALKQGYREDAGLFCASDDDEQLIITIPFRQIVYLSSIAIQGPADGTAPKVVKIFVNKPNLSFDNCAKKATEQLTLTADQVTNGEQLELDFTQFQNVRVVSIFVDSNQGGGDVTNVSKIIINGAPVHTTNMSELKKC